MIRCQGLGVRRGDRWLVRGLDLALPRGSFTALTGASGSGKSSLIATLAGTLAPGEGTVSLPGPAPLGVIFQDLRLVRSASALHNVGCGHLGRLPWWRTLLGLPADTRQAAHQELEALGLAHLAQRWVAQMSGGEQQRTAIARTLMHRPDIILADEPVANLDEPLAERVLSRLRQECSERGCTVLVALHHPGLVQRFADRELHLDPASWSLR